MLRPRRHLPRALDAAQRRIGRIQRAKRRDEPRALRGRHAPHLPNFAHHRVSRRPRPPRRRRWLGQAVARAPLHVCLWLLHLPGGHHRALRRQRPEGRLAGHVPQGGPQGGGHLLHLHRPADRRRALPRLHERLALVGQHPRPLRHGGHGRHHQRHPAERQARRAARHALLLLGLLHHAGGCQPSRDPLLLSDWRANQSAHAPLPRAGQLRRDRLVPALARGRAHLRLKAVPRRGRPGRRRHARRRLKLHALLLPPGQRAIGAVRAVREALQLHDAQVVP
mmetsp:Transcript_36959/g.81168  ORF Transcript_36959/g.81168 Transcript_36959/m.81168 type:complete len:280 (+) Transcript_36959:4805-5644(+)